MQHSTALHLSYVRRKDTVYGKPGKRPDRVMRSFYKDDPDTEWMQEIAPTQRHEDYLKWVENVNSYLEVVPNGGVPPIKAPSELWLQEDEEIEPLNITDMNEEFEPGSWEHEIRKAAKQDLNVNKWQNDEHLKKILQSTERKANEFLTPLGQQLRHDILEGVMWQLNLHQEFQKQSHWNMYKYIMARCLTELILEKQGMRRVHPGTPQLAQQMDDAKNELDLILDYYLHKYDIRFDNLVRNDVKQMIIDGEY